MKYIIYVLCLFLSTLSYAQGPGLGGKLFTVEYSFVSGIGGENIYTKKGIESDIESNAFFPSIVNVEHKVGVGYALSRSAKVGLFYKRGVDGLRIQYNSSGYDNSGSYFNIDFDNKFLLTSNTIGANIEFFKTSYGAIAPLGSYVNVELFSIFNSLELVEGGSEKETYSDLGLGVSWGINRPLFPSTFLKLELGFAVTKSLFKVYLSDSAFEDDYYTVEEDNNTIEEEIELQVQKRNTLMNMFNVKLGIVQAF